MGGDSKIPRLLRLARVEGRLRVEVGGGGGGERGVGFLGLGLGFRV